MTTIVAARKGKTICIGADTLSTYNDMKESVKKHVRPIPKIFRHHDLYVGTSGDAVWADVLKNYFRKHPKSFLFRSTDELFVELSRLYKVLKEDYSLVSRSGEYDNLVSSEHTLLLANPAGLFEVDCYRDIRQCTQFCAIGTGKKYALGAMCAVYDIIKDPKDIVKVGVEAACQFDCYSDLPADYFSVAAT